jgi:polar amino acid transport system substrate-binding protein
MIRLLSVLFLGLVVGLGCGQKSETPPRPLTHILIGVDPDYPPFEYRDSVSGEVVGFDIDLAGMICDFHHWQYEFVALPFEDLIQAVKRGQVDMAVSAISITSERKTWVAFSDPYYLTGQAIAVPITDTAVTGPGDLRGKRVGVVSGTTGEAMAKKMDGVLVYPYFEPLEGLVDMTAGRLEAFIGDRPVLRAARGQVSGVRLLPGTISSEYFGIAMRQNDTLRLAMVNDALASLVGGYSFERLHQQWFGYPLLDVAVPDSVARQWGD